MPGGSYLMTSSFSYRKLKKLPTPATPHDEHGDEAEHPPPAPTTTSIQDYYHSYYRALGAAVARRRRQQQLGAPASATTGRTAWGRRRGGARRPRLRISSLARALRRKAAAVGSRVRASVAKVAARLREGRPYIGDLFAGNYMFMQVGPSPTMAGLDGDKGFSVPFADYYYATLMKSRPAPALQLHHAAAAGEEGKV
ncbi:hypothetical protein EJB05_16538, partial [Eragrostis curvula]